MHLHVLPEAELGDAPLFVVVRSGAEPLPAFERKFRVDHQCRRLIGHEHHTIGPGAVAERVLEGKAPLRQPIADDRLHAALAEGAAGLLVGEDRLEAHHVLAEFGDVGLRAVDDGEPLVERAERLRRLGVGFGERLTDALALCVEPLVDRTHEVGGARAEDLRHRLHARVHFVLALQHAGELALEILRLLPRRLGLRFTLLGLEPASVVLAQRQQHQCNQQHRGKPRRRKQQGRQRHGGVAQGENDSIHRLTLAHPVYDLFFCPPC